MSDVSSILPPNRSELETAFEAAIRASGPELAQVSTLMDPERCPKPLLGWLAWAFSVDVWDPTWSETTKRSVVKTTLSVHRLKGTVGAVRRAMTAVYGDCELREWFETGGAPHTFRASISGEVRGASSIATALGIIERAKPVRSHLEAIEVATPAETALRIGGAVGARLSQEIDADFPRTTLSHVAGVAVAIRMTQEISHG